MNKTLVFPNPTSNFLKIEYIESVAIDILIKDFFGRTIIKHNNISDGKISVDVSSLQNGIYFIELISSDGLFDTRKLIKK